MNDFMRRGYDAVEADNIKAAAQWFEKALEANPDDPKAQAWLGQCLCSLYRNVEGVAYLRQAGTYFLRDSSANKNTSMVLEVISQLQYWGDFQGALELLNQVIKGNNSDFRSFQLLAATYAQLNKKTEAMIAGEQAIKLAPKNIMMQVFQASLEADEGLNDVARQRLEKVLHAQPNAREGFRAHKELARVLDKLGNYGEVFSHLHVACELAKSLPEYSNQNMNLIPNMLKANKQSYNRELLGRWSGIKFNVNPPSPVFLMGFMRSGTTLTQEVLDAHPDIFVSDETDFIGAMQNELHKMDNSNKSTAAKLEQLDLVSVTHLRNFYWTSVYWRYGDVLDQRVFVDKFTMNTIDLGVINFIFPDARIIFVMRDPRDICLSCFMQLMVPTAITVHLLSWQGTANIYAQVMDWWIYIKQQMTLDFIEFRYEDAISEFESTFRKVFEFLGVVWDPVVISFHKHAAEKIIATPSRTQVTKPLYSSSVNRWQHFESEMQSISELLNPVISALDYQACQDFSKKKK